MKRIIHKSIVAAYDESVDTRLDDAISTLEDDFEYVIMGLEHLGRQSANATSEALMILGNLTTGIKSALEDIADATNNQSK